jgi:hypothetical protein
MQDDMLDEHFASGKPGVKTSGQDYGLSLIPPMQGRSHTHYQVRSRKTSKANGQSQQSSNPKE